MKHGSANKVPQYLAALTSSLTCLSAGATLGWGSQLTNDFLNGKLGFSLTNDELGWAGSLVYLGAAVLSLFTGTIADFTGRKLLMLLLVLPATMGWSLLIWANNIFMIFFGRFITGMVAGSFTVLCSMYSNEIAQKEIRGALGSYTQLMITSGIFYSCAVAPFLQYKYYTLCCAAIPLVFAVLFIPMPETPFHLLRKNNVKKAYASLVQLRGRAYDVDKEILAIQSSLEKEKLNSGINVALQCLRKRSTRKACLIGFGLMFFKSSCGIDALTAYTVYIFTNANVGISPSTAVIILCSSQVVTAVIQSFAVDRFGRRALMCISGTVMALCLIVVGITFLIKEKELIAEEYYAYINYLPLIAIILFCVFFSVGIGPIPWLLMGEIFPQEIKSLASSIGTFITWITAFAVAKLFIIIDSSCGSATAFFIFAVCTILNVLFVFVLVPETKNKSFEEIQKELQ